MKLQLEIQKYLRLYDDYTKDNHRVLVELEEKHGIIWKTEEDNNGRKYLLLNYGIFSKPSAFTKECRGLVLDARTLEIVRYGFERFYNYQEECRDKIDKNKPIIYEEKSDGSLIFLHHINDLGWNAGTRGKLFANTNVNDYEITFNELFWSIFGQDNIVKLDRNICYLFELCAQQNRVVIAHAVPHVVLLGGRNRNNDWQELNDDEITMWANKFNVSASKKFAFKNIKDCFDKTKVLNAKQEGCVVKQWYEENGIKKLKRVKIKSIEYIALHNIVSAKSLNSLTKIAIANGGEILKDFPEYVKACDAIKEAIDEFVKNAQEVYDKNKDILFDVGYGDFKKRRKNFAQKVMATPYGDVCFSLADGHIATPIEYLRQKDSNSHIKGVIKRLKLHDVVDKTWTVVDNVDEDI